MNRTQLISQILTSFLIIVLCGNTCAQDTIPNNENTLLLQEHYLEIDGLMVDQTITKSGHDLYDMIYNKWEAPPDIHDYNITIKELPFRLINTQIEVYINEELISSSILQPRQDLIEELANRIVEAIKQYLNNYKEISIQLGEDQTGTGIF